MLAIRRSQRPVVSSFYIAFLIGLIAVQTATASLSGDDDEDLLSNELIDWIRDGGGFISDKIEIAAPEGGGPRGIFARDILDEREVIFSLPWDLILRPTFNDYRKSNVEDIECGTARAVHRAMSDPNPTPYAKYLALQPRRYLPAYWSKEGKSLLQSIVGNGVPPFHIADEIEDWEDECEGADASDELQVHSRMLVTARSDDDIMVPFYDMFNHRNGERNYNIRHRTFRGKKFELVTERQIEPGEELYNSYNQCNNCQGRKDSFGTPEMFQHHGFVEMPPQRWILGDVRLKFDIDYRADGSGDLEAKFFKSPSEVGIAYLIMQLKRLRRYESALEDGVMADAISMLEKDLIRQYHGVMVNAFTLALESSEKGKVSDEVWEWDEVAWFVEVEDIDDENDNDDQDDDEYNEEEEEDEDEEYNGIANEL